MRGIDWHLAGVDVHWIKSPPKQGYCFSRMNRIVCGDFDFLVTQDVPFNVSYSLELTPQFFQWAINELPQPLYTYVFGIFHRIDVLFFSLSLRLSNQTMNTTQAWYQWCKEHQPTIDVDDPNIASDACLWHINVHACAIGRSVQYCGPW